jgi:hypothetical protein
MIALSFYVFWKDWPVKEIFSNNQLLGLFMLLFVGTMWMQFYSMICEEKEEKLGKVEAA